MTVNLTVGSVCQISHSNPTWFAHELFVSFSAQNAEHRCLRLETRSLSVKWHRLHSRVHHWRTWLEKNPWKQAACSYMDIDIFFWILHEAGSTWEPRRPLNEMGTEPPTASVSYCPWTWRMCSTYDLCHTLLFLLTAFSNRSHTKTTTQQPETDDLLHTSLNVPKTNIVFLLVFHFGPGRDAAVGACLWWWGPLPLTFNLFPSLGSPPGARPASVSISVGKNMAWKRVKCVVIPYVWSC